VSSNEIAERFSAACWVKCGSLGGEGVNQLEPSTVQLRSYVGFQNRIITTSNALTRPLFVLPLDHAVCRSKAAVFATRLGTVGPTNDPIAARESYPAFGGTIPESVAQVIVQPIQLAWLGPDLTNPVWLPFNLPGADQSTVPDGFDLDVFDAVAVLLPGDTEGLSGDFCVFVEVHPIIETADLPLRPLLPADAIPPEPPTDPIDELGPYARWRMDTFTTITDEGGEHVVSFTGLAGAEGVLNQNGDTQSPPGPNPNFNNQPTWTPVSQPLVPFDGMATDPSFWSVLLSGDCDFFIVWGVVGPDPSSLVESLSSQFDIVSSGSPGDLDLSLGTAGGLGIKTLTPGPADSAAQILYFRGGTPSIGEFTFANTAPAIDTALYLTPPPEATTDICQFPSDQAAYAEILLFNRNLDPTEFATVITYFTTRYGAVAPS
jgi:hypothetical protein